VRPSEEHRSTGTRSLRGAILRGAERYIADIATYKFKEFEVSSKMIMLCAMYMHFDPASGGD
jgi:hypothetical protein